MAKKTKKRGEKLGDVVGRKRPILGSSLIMIGVILLAAMLGYDAGQDIFFKEYFESLMPSTESAGANICGRIGATFCMLSFAAIGFATFMIPVYLIWAGLLCFQRRAKAFSKTFIIAIVGGVFLLSILSSIFQTYLYGSNLQSDAFVSGWGGKFGYTFFDLLLYPLLNLLGSVMLIGVLYVFCLVVVFVESPLEAARELGGIAKKSPSLFFIIAKIIWIVISFIPRKLFARKKLVEDVDSSLPKSEMIDAPTPSPVASTPEIAQQSPEITTTDRVPADVKLDEVFNSIFENTPIKDVPEYEEVEPKYEEDEPEYEEDDITITPVIEEPTTNKKSDTTDFKEYGEGDLKTDPIPEVVPEPISESHDGFKVETFKSEKYEAPIQKKKGDFVFPPIDILSKPPQAENLEHDDYDQRMQEIVDHIGNFGLKVIPVRASSGPVITRYEVRPAPGVRVNKIAVLQDDIAIGIRAQKVRVIAPIPGAGTIGIEIPNKIRQSVCLRDIIESKEWNESTAKIPIALGKDVTGIPIVLDLTKMPHALIAGSTGSGKSVCVNSIIASLLYKMTPDDLRFIMVDPKVVEMQIYNSLPHMLVPVVTNPKKVPGALKWLIEEMDRRYKIFSMVNVKNIGGFNALIAKNKEEAREAAELDAQLTATQTPEERTATIEAASNNTSIDDGEFELPDKKLPYIVCIIDELADLMMVAGKEVETYIARLTQLARAAGIHLLVATQRPSTDVITGLIKSNLPTRIAFRSASLVDSRTILDCKGAETLIGTGDMLFKSAGSSDLVRAQGAFTSDAEVAAMVEALKVNGEPEFAEDVQAQIDSSLDDDDMDDSDSSDGQYADAMTGKAIAVIKANKKASTSLLQRKLKIGYGRAARIIDELEDMGMIGPDDGSGKREIFID